MTQEIPPFRDHPWGYCAIIFGALALSIALLNIFGGPFSPQAPIGQTIGEIAGDIRASALRAVSGAEQPPKTVRGWDIDRILLVAAPLFGVGALLLATVSALAGDPRRLAAYGAAFGVSAIAIQVVWWLVIIIAAMMLIVAIIENIDGILGG
ncbi:MAG: hypothetical protein KTR21_13080 [Rhodobacteraceae bacterium]|nr:hypothetical protein [Paracoccaceae bacterium]